MSLEQTEAVFLLLSLIACAWALILMDVEEKKCKK